MSINPEHLRSLTNNVLKTAGLYSSRLYSAEGVQLCLGTFAVESDNGTHLWQLEGGRGRGIGQIEPDTERWLWKYMDKTGNEDLKKAVIETTGIKGPNESAMLTNLAYQIIMTRIRYIEFPYPLPGITDLEGQAWYWDNGYNRNKIDETEKYKRKFNLYYGGISQA